MKNMMKISFSIVVLLFITLITTSSYATLLGLNIGNPDILSDSTGVYGYNSCTDTITFSATALTVTFDGITPTGIDNGSYFAQFHVDNTGHFSGGISGDDLRINGKIDVDNDGTYEYDGLLISGNVTNFGFFDATGPYAYFDYVFDVTGGSLAAFYTDGIGADIVSSDYSTFNDNWNINHGGIKVKHDTGPVTTPVPPSWMLTLLSIGMVCVGKRQYI